MSDATPESDDQRLVSAFLAERREADFVPLYRRHTPALYRSALRLSGGVAGEAEDAVQEAWSRALHQLAAFRWESSLRTWLTGIVVRCVQEATRRAHRAGHTVELDENAPAGDTADALAARPFDDIAPEAVARAIGALPSGYRSVLVLHDVEGWTHETIASALSIAPGTSKSQLARARRRLRTVLETERTDARGRQR